MTPSCSPTAHACSPTSSSSRPATRQGLEPLIGHLGVLDEKGRPVERGGRTARGAKGLWFTGYTNPISGMLRELSIDARKIALAMAMAKRREIKALRRRKAA